MCNFQNAHVCTSNLLLTLCRHSINFAYCIATGDEGDHNLINVGYQTALDFSKDDDKAAVLVSNPHGQDDEAKTPCLSNMELNTEQDKEVNESSVPNPKSPASGMFSMCICVKKVIVTSNAILTQLLTQKKQERRHWSNRS